MLDRVHAERAAGVVDEHVEVAEPGGRLRDGVGVGDVEHERPRARQVGGDPLEAVGTASGEDDLVAVTGEGGGGGGPDAGASSGDESDRHAAIQPPGR